MKNLKRFAGRGAVSAFCLSIIAFAFSAFWIDWHEMIEDSQGLLAVFIVVLIPIIAILGAGIGAFVALLVYLNEQS